MSTYYCCFFSEDTNCLVLRHKYNALHISGTSKYLPTIYIGQSFVYFIAMCHSESLRKMFHIPTLHSLQLNLVRRCLPFGVQLSRSLCPVAENSTGLLYIHVRDEFSR